jgi:hypothetical protein
MSWRHCDKGQEYVSLDNSIEERKEKSDVGRKIDGERGRFKTSEKSQIKTKNGH